MGLLARECQCFFRGGEWARGGLLICTKHIGPAEIFFRPCKIDNAPMDCVML